MRFLSLFLTLVLVLSFLSFAYAKDEKILTSEMAELTIKEWLNTNHPGGRIFKFYGVHQEGNTAKTYFTAKYGPTRRERRMEATFYRFTNGRWFLIGIDLDYGKFEEAGGIFLEVK